MANHPSQVSVDASPTPTPTLTPPAYTPPPPELPSHIIRRRYIVFSYWLIVLCLGLPIWWHTTAIYRANLPLNAMMQWADGKACRPVFPLTIDLHADALPDAEALHLVRLTQHALDDLDEFSAHHLRLQLASRRQDQLNRSHHTDATKTALTIHCRPGDAATSSLSPHRPILDITYPPNAPPQLSSTSSPLVTLITNELRSTFAEEQSIISYLLSAASSSSSSSSSTTSSTPAAPGRPSSLTTPPDASVDKALSKRMTRSLRYSPTYHLTFSLFTHGALPNSWAIEHALHQYMQPVLDVLAPIHNFTVDTQVQLYATPGDPSDVLTSGMLSSFINAAEWPLSPSIGAAPTVNFVVYVGNQTIRLDDDDDDDDDDNAQSATATATCQSWMIPQWGAVFLLPAPADKEAHVSAATLRQPMLNFGSHLLSLLGTPASPASSLPLRLSSLARIRTTDLLLRASSTLGSLARLTEKLPSIAIPPSVADGVDKTLHHLDRACASLSGDGSADDGLMHARIADSEAERAFFEKSMVGQLYFPDEHKIAVYLPLLGPISVPLVMCLVAEMKAWLAKRRKRAAAEVGEKKMQ